MTFPKRDLICANQDAVADYVYDFYSICGETDSTTGDYYPSPAEEVCQQWQMICGQSGIPIVSKMCTEQPPSTFSVEIDEFCYMMSSDFEPYFNELVDAEGLCANTQNICDSNGDPWKSEICLAS